MLNIGRISLKVSKNKPYTTVDTILELLRASAQPELLEHRTRKFGVHAKNSLGLTIKQIKEIAKGIPKDAKLALQLFDLDIYEAKLLLPLLFSPKQVTPELMESWSETFDTWEICDHFALSFLGQTPYAYDKVFEWVKREGEFQRRAGFVLMVGYGLGHKKACNEDFEAFLPLIQQYADDNRNFVKKAVNWALRAIGKRNVDLNQKARICAEELLQQENKSAQWIAKDALREFNKEGFKTQCYPRETYGN